MSGGIRLGRPLRAGPYLVREIAYGAGYRQRAHWHPVMGVTIVFGGSIREVAAGREEHGQALSVVVKPAGVEHTDEVGNRGARTLQIAFDPGEAGRLFEAEPAFAQWRWLHGGAAAESLLALLRLARTGAVGGASAEERVLDALGALHAEAPAAGDPPHWLERARAGLEDSDASVRDLARDVGVHEVSLSRAFRRWYGRTVSEHRRRARLRRAAPAIEAGADAVSRIAHASGFADHAHLCRDFRRTTGLTPSAFRDLARGPIG